MIEVFIAFSHMSMLEELEKTLNAWSLEGIDTIAVQVRPKKFEIERRVVAENMAHDNYILAELGFGPLEQNFGELAEKELKDRPEVGLFGAWRTGQTANELPNSVVICRKGIIKQWPQPQGSTYIREHSEAYRIAGYKTFLCSTLHYHPLAVQLPC